MATLPPLHNLSLGVRTVVTHPTGVAVTLVPRVRAARKRDADGGEVSQSSSPKSLSGHAVANFSTDAEVKKNLNDLLEDLGCETEKGRSFVNNWRHAICTNMRSKRLDYNEQIRQVSRDIASEEIKQSQVAMAARQGAVDGYALVGGGTKGAEHTKVWDIVDTSRWNVLIQKAEAIRELSDAIDERVEVINNAEDWKASIARFINTLRSLKDYPDQTGMVEKIIDVVRAFVKNPKIASNQFFNVMIMGDAGTGKTRLAKIVASIFSQLGLYVHDSPVEATSGDFIAGFVGQTEEKVVKFLSMNVERVIFLDEAYALTEWNETHTKLQGYSPEAVAELIGFLSKNVGRIGFIVAGYEDKMKEDFLPANEGFARRFPIRATLLPYKKEVLYKIFIKSLALTYMGMEPLEREALLVYEAELGTRVQAFEKLFTNEAKFLFYDVIAASKETSIVDAPMPSAPPPQNQTDAENAKMERRLSIHEEALRILNCDEDDKKPESFERFQYPHLAQLFKAQAGAMNNMAGVASALLSSAVSESDLDNFEADRSVMTNIIMTFIEATFTGIVDGALQVDLARKELMRALNKGDWVTLLEEGGEYVWQDAPERCVVPNGKECDNPITIPMKAENIVLKHRKDPWADWTEECSLPITDRPWQPLGTAQPGGRGRGGRGGGRAAASGSGSESESASAAGSSSAESGVTASSEALSIEPDPEAVATYEYKGKMYDFYDNLSPVLTKKEERESLRRYLAENHSTSVGELGKQSAKTEYQHAKTEWYNKEIRKASARGGTRSGA
tara:strand:+ start:193 stop:2556 length:2364 start_codon:yes stop_codon:yes gene_type:complete